MKKLKALLIAICLILAILIFNIPDINYGRGAGDGIGHEYSEEEYVGS